MVAVAFAVMCASRLSGIQRDLETARAGLREAAAQLEDGELADARTSLRTALALLVSTNERLYSSPELQVAAGLPVARQNLESLRESNGLALRLAGGAVRILDVAASLEDEDGSLEIPLRDGALPLEVVSAVRQELTSLSADLPGTGSHPSFLLPAVREAADELAEEVERRRPQIDNLAQALTMLNELAGGNGDRRYLLAVANTAEMRGTGGMYLSYGVLETREGDLSLPAFGGIDELFLTSGVDPASVGAETTELTRWSGLEPTRLWRNANLLPDLAAVGPRLLEMYTAATGLPVDGVIQVDADGLAALLEGIGAVEVPELGTVTADNVVALTLNEAYVRFPDRDQRQEVLGDVAEAAFQRLVDGEYDSLRPLATAMLRAGNERHISLWSPFLDLSGPAAYFGVDAALPPPEATDALLLTVQNFGRDKLDFYLGTAVAVTGSRPVGVLSDVTVDVTLTNDAPAGVDEPAYIFGTDQDRQGVAPGVYRGVASLYVPNGTALRASSGTIPTTPVLTTEASRTVIGFDVEVPPGESITVRLELTFPPRPPGPYRLQLAPLPRVRPTSWAVEIDTGEGRARREGPLEVAEIVAPVPP